MDATGLEGLLPQDAALILEIRRQREEAATGKAAASPPKARTNRTHVIVAGVLYAAAAVVGALMVRHGWPGVVWAKPIGAKAGDSYWANIPYDHRAKPVWIGFGFTLIAASVVASGALIRDTLRAGR